jgi:ribonuclease BN (tRNA processing enzyme)
MKLTVLGGAAAGGNPGQGCSGYLVQDGQTSVVLDLGPATLPQLRLHADFRTLDAIVVSHLHLDHVLDLLALRYALAYNPQPPQRRLPLWLPPGGLAFFSGLRRALAEAGEEDGYFADFAMAEYDPSSSLVIGSLTVRFTPTVHYVPCWAMRIADRKNDGDLVYTADTGPAADLAPFSRGSAVVVAEAAAAGGSAEPITARGHLTAAEAGLLAREAGAETLVLAHYWHERDPEGALQEARRVFGGRVELAVPGLAIGW